MDYHAKHIRYFWYIDYMGMSFPVSGQDLAISKVYNVEYLHISTIQQIFKVKIYVLYL